MDLKFVELHSPLFIKGLNKVGYNLGVKLDPSAKPGLTIEFDEEKHMLFVTFQGQTALVPLSNVLSMTLGKPEVKEVKAGATSWHANPVSKEIETFERAAQIDALKDNPNVEAYLAKQAKTKDKSKIDKAQVSTPQSHVFEGAGSGKTGQEKG